MFFASAGILRRSLGGAALATAFGLGLGLGLIAPAEAAQPSGEWDYVVYRDGSPIGDHSISFTPSGDQLQVAIKTDIAVKVAFITAFRFEHTSHEVWKDGKLQALTASTNDDGKQHEVAVKSSPDGLQVTVDGTTGTRPAETLIHDQWNMDNLTRTTLLSAFDGTDYKVSFSGPSEETLTIGTRTYATRKYASTGDLVRTFWFDDQDRLVRVEFESRGSNVVYEIKK